MDSGGARPDSGARRPNVLIVDDEPENIGLLSALLSGTYRTTAATTGDEALEAVLTATPPDLILLDVVLPGVDGYEVCRRLKQDARSRDIPVIFLTSRSEAEDEERGFQLGAVDYITKPWSASIVRARIRTHLDLKAARDFLKDRSVYLEGEVARRTREVVTVQDATMVAMGSLAETRDNETGNHIRRTQHYVKLLAAEIQGHPRFSTFLSNGSGDILYKSAPLHDIGKVGIPDRILLKPGRLETEEFEIMKTHTVLGRQAIQAAERLIESENNFLRIAGEIAWTHHERWDGTGYPRGLAEEQIPIPGRIMAVADVYDALISRRVYKEPVPHAQALDIVREGRGSHFDPDVSDALLRIGDDLRQISARYSEGNAV